jgi:hypothetical protein
LLVALVLTYSDENPTVNLHIYLGSVPNMYGIKYRNIVQKIRPVFKSAGSAEGIRGIRGIKGIFVV